jgi:hypothetical protein
MKRDLLATRASQRQPMVAAPQPRGGTMVATAADWSTATCC